MEKRKEFTRDTIEVCRNCKSKGKVEVEGYVVQRFVTCPVCGGSGLVRKRISGVVCVEPYNNEKV